jgi:hypothetical protein
VKVLTGFSWLRVRSTEGYYWKVKFSFLFIKVIKVFGMKKAELNV